MACPDDPGRELARIALNGAHDGKMLKEALAYCWDRLGYFHTENEMAEIRVGLPLDPDASFNGDALEALLEAHREEPFGAVPMRLRRLEGYFDLGALAAELAKRGAA